MKKMTVLLRARVQVVGRISRLVIAGLLCCVSLNALAAITAATEYMYTEVLWGIPPTAWGTDRAALCASMSSAWNAKVGSGKTGYTQYVEVSGFCDFYSVDSATGVKRVGESIGPAHRYVCPVGSTISNLGNPPQCSCNTNEGFQENSSSCVASVPELSVADPLRGSQSGGQCRRPIAGASTPYPILPATGEKYRSESDFVDSGPAPLSFIRTYRSKWSNDASRIAAAMGQVWSHNHNYTLSATPIGAPRDVTLTLPEGYVRLFGKAASASIWTASNSIDTLTQLSSGA